MKKNVIVILGGGINPDGSLPNTSRNNTDKGIELFKKSVSNLIIMSGGISFQLKYKPPKTEAKAMKDYAVQAGVPEDNILLEEDSKDTIGNAYFTKIDFLKPNNWKNLVVTTSDFHMKRTEYIFKKILGPKYQTDFVKAPSKLTQTDFENRIKVEEKILFLIKEWLERIKDGDDPKIKELLYTKHPGYADNPEISKEDAIMMVNEISGSE